MDALLKKIKSLQDQDISEDCRSILDYMAYFHILDSRDDDQKQPAHRPARQCQRREAAELTIWEMD